MEAQFQTDWPWPLKLEPKNGPNQYAVIANSTGSTLADISQEDMNVPPLRTD